MENYYIIRFRRNPVNGDVSKRVIKRGLTKEAAMEHCNREDTHGENWFDGFSSEEVRNGIAW